jgi:RNA polymerase sigma-70 factor (ECF subfamily)
MTVGESIAEAFAENHCNVRARLVRRGVRSADVDDLRQEVFLIAFKRQVVLGAAPASKAWLDQVCDFVALAHRRKAYRRREILKDVDDDEELVRVASSTSSDVSERSREQLHRALAALQPEDQDLLALHLVGDMPFRTLAAIDGRDVKTVRKRFQLAAQRLRRALRQAVAEMPAATERDGVPPTVTRAGGQTSSGLKVDALDHVLIVVWRGAWLGSESGVLRSAAEALAARHSRLLVLNLFEPGWPMPGFDERQSILGALAHVHERCSAFGIVGAGSIQRGAEQLMRALTFRLGARLALATFSEVEAAAAWLFPARSAALASAARKVLALTDS